MIRRSAAPFPDAYCGVVAAAIPTIRNGTLVLGTHGAAARIIIAINEEPGGLPDELFEDRLDLIQILVVVEVLGLDI
jgi:hypothetical protein